MEARADRTANALRPVPVERQPVSVHQARGPRAVVRLWLPLTPLFLLLSPFAVLLSPLLYLAPQPYGARPLATILGVGQLLLSLSGTVVDVDTPEALVSIRIF
jgi:hypothetical protein